MSSDDKKRLASLKKGGGRSLSFLDGLDYFDLLLLLAEDKKVRKLIRKIVANMDEEAEPACELESVQEDTTPVLSRQSVLSTPPVAVDGLRQELSAELTLLKLVKADTELSAAWLFAAQDMEGAQLARLIAIVAQWDQVLQLWDRLAERCKSEQRAASADEKQILVGSIRVHNLIWQGKQARLEPAELGAEYDYQNHERGTAKGAKITEQWLPGLLNAAGQLQKKSLVRT